MSTRASGFGVIVSIAFIALQCSERTPQAPPDAPPENVASTANALSVPNDYIGSWRLDETTGTTAADAYTTAPHAGTLYNGSTANANGPAWGAAKLGNGLTFDGIDDSVRIADFSYGPAFSVGFWFKITDNTGAAGDYNVLFNHGTMWAANNVTVLVPKSGDAGAGELWTYVVDANDATYGFGIARSGTANWADGAWHYYALTVGTCATCLDNTRAYVDGQLRLSADRGGDAINPTTPIFLGLRSDATKATKGALDEVRLYNRALTQQEVSDLYLLTAPDDYVGYWQLDQTSGTVATDSYTAAPHNGTLYEGSTASANGPAWTAGGKVGVPRSLTFDGVNDNVRVSDFAYGPAFSVAFWFKINNNTGASGDWNTLFAHGTLWTANNVTVVVPKSGDAGNGEIWTYVVDTNDATAGVGVPKPTGGSWADGAWHHYGVTIGTCPTCPDNTKIYVDGALKLTTQRGGDSINPATSIFLGTRTDVTGPLNGALDDVRLFNRTLSSQEMANLAAFTGAVCGNGAIEIGEDCESPFASCCDSQSCKFLASGTTCADTTLTDCKSPQCTGTSATCNQTAANIPNGTACGDGICNECSNGTCVATASGVAGPGCTVAAAQCSNADTCDGAGSCSANNWTDGTTCTTGTCAGGTCQASPAPPGDYVGYWRLNETGGTTAGDSNATAPHVGTLYNGATANANGPIWTSAGKVGGALSFDGTNDSVRIADFAYGPAFSVSFWFKVTNNTGSSGDASTLFTHGNLWTANNVTVRIPKSGDAGYGEIWTYVVDANDATAGFGVPRPSGGSWADGAWHHYGLTVGTCPTCPDNARVYVDGVQKITFQSGGDSFNPATPIYLGLRSDGTEALVGAVDEVRMYNRAITASDVTSIYNDATPTPPPPPPPTVPLTTATYTEATDNVLNPERGWFRYVAIGGSFSGLRSPGNPTNDPPATLATVKLDLDQNAATIPAGTITNLVSTLAAARTAGVKVVLRPLYRPDDTAASGSDPTTASFVISHVRQLGPTLREQADVIASVELGFLGPWGEFWGSPLIDNGNWVGVLGALLEEVPTSRTIQVRRPCYKDHYFGGRGPIQATEAFGGTAVARVGHFNDCFLANTIDDQSTFVNYPGTTPTKTVDGWRTYAASDTKYTPVGGETCGNNGRATCDAARTDGALFHWSFLGSGWNQNTVGPFGTLAAGNCRTEIGERLGYRFVLEQATYSTAVRPGETLELTVRLRNEGFASTYNQRPVYVVLQNATTTYLAELTGDDTDPRHWWGGETRTFSRKLGIPSGAATGTYSLYLWLPDAYASIRDRADYAIRFANDGAMWGATSGYNRLTSSLSIATTATQNTSSPQSVFVLQ